MTFFFNTTVGEPDIILLHNIFFLLGEGHFIAQQTFLLQQRCRQFMGKIIAQLTILPQQASTARGIDNFIEQLFYLSRGGNSSWDR